MYIVKLASSAVDVTMTTCYTLYLPAFCLPVRIIAQFLLILQIVKIRSLCYCQWPMVEVEVEVVQLQVLERELAGWEDIFWGVVSAPES